MTSTAFLPNRLYTFSQGDNSAPVVPHVPMGEDYLVYMIVFATDAAGEQMLMQNVLLSKALNDANGEYIANDVPFLCGSINQTGASIRFLHTDTINELVRMGNSLYCTKMADRLTVVQRPSLDEPTTPREGLTHDA